MTISRWSRIQKQILVWAGEEPLRLAYNGDELLIPARNEVADSKEPGTRFRWDSAQTRAGHFVPGTLLVTDKYAATPDGGQKQVFNVNDFCAYLDRERQDLFKRGFAIVSDPEDVTPIMREQLIPAWEANMDDRAREIINTELERRKKLEAKGNPLTPGSSEHLVMWAFRHMAKRQATAAPMLSTDDLFKVASGSYQAPPEEQKKPEYTAPDSPQALFNEAKNLEIRLSKTELEGLFLDDEETKQAITEKVRAKRRELEELAAS